MVALAVWLALLPFRIAYRLGFRGTVALICVLVLTVSVYGIAEDLGLLETPAIAAPRKPGRRPVRQPPASSTATADIPRGYLALYRQAGARYRVPWSTLAGIGKVESDHGRSRLPGVRSDANFAGACGPMQIGCVSGSRAGNSWARYGHGDPHDPANAIPAAARYLVGHGAHRNPDRPSTPTTTPPPTSRS
jgi:membrane-bound lytic murein transglycosylase B